jgi:hypothetical protein
MCFIMYRTYVFPLLCFFLFFMFCGSSHMYWDLLLACRVVELPIDIFVLWLWVAPVGCSGIWCMCCVLMVPSGSY